MKHGGLILVSLLIITSFTRSQTTRIVDQGGTPGSYPTISSAVSAANAGDTILVLSGIYSESVVISKKLFVIAQDSTVEVVSGTNAFTFNNGASGSMLYGFTLKGNVHHPRNYTQSEPIIISNNRFIKSYIDFTNWTIIANNYFFKSSDGYGIKTYGSDSSNKRIIVFNNVMDSCGIQMTGNYTSIIANRISEYPGYGILTHQNPNDFQIIANKINKCNRGIVFGGNSSNTNFVVANNLITNCQVGINNASGWTSPLFTGIISNNVVYNSSTSAVLNEQGLNGSSSVYFYSNIFSTNAGNASFSSSIWDYNCFYSSGSVPTSGSNNITSDPLFENPMLGDFRLQTDSPCINTGHTNLIYSDIDRTRNDMGIYGGPNTISNYENLTDAKVINIFLSPTQVIKGNNIIITGSGISK